MAQTPFIGSWANNNNFCFFCEQCWLQASRNTTNFTWMFPVSGLCRKGQGKEASPASRRLLQRANQFHQFLLHHVSFLSKISDYSWYQVIACYFLVTFFQLFLLICHHLEISVVYVVCFWCFVSVQSVLWVFIYRCLLLAGFRWLVGDG